MSGRTEQLRLILGLTALVGLTGSVLSGCASPPSGTANETSNQQQTPEPPPPSKPMAGSAEPDQSTATPPPESKPAMEPPAAVVTPAPTPESPQAVVAAPSDPVGEPAQKPPTKKQLAKPQPVQETKKSAPPEQKPTLPTAPNTLLITSADKDKTHPRFGQGSDQAFLVNGKQGDKVVLSRGQTYTFDVKTGVAHDFYLTSNPAGWGSATYVDGVEGQFTYRGEVTFAPTVTAPDVLYYQCRNHKYMGGTIYIVNKGEKPKVEKADTSKEVASPTFKVTDQQVKQKLAYGQMLLGSAAVKKVDASSNPDASALVVQAKEMFAKGQTLQSKGDNTQALAAADEGLRLLNSATRLVATTTVEKDYAAEYEPLHKEVKGYFAAYQKNAKSQSKDKISVKFDEDKFVGLVKEAEGAAGRQDHKSAVESLHKASAMVTAALSVMLDSATVVYEQSFDTPKDEFDFEVARYESYRELVPIAIEQRNPSASQVAMMDEFVAKADRIVDEGKPFAERGDYTTAIQALQAATDNVKRALMIAGVR